MVTIMVIGLDEKRREVEVNPERTTLGDLKRRIESWTNIAVEDQRFVPSNHAHKRRGILYQQQQMSIDQKTLGQLGIVSPNSNTTLSLFLVHVPRPFLLIQHEPKTVLVVDDFYGVDAGLLASDPDDPDYDEEDHEADAVWDAIDALLKNKKKMKKMEQLPKHWPWDSVKRDLLSLSPEDWDKI